MRQLWTRAAVIALTAGTLAACESTGGAQYPTRGQAPPTPNFPIVQAPVADQQPEGPRPRRTSRSPTSPLPRQRRRLQPAAGAGDRRRTPAAPAAPRPNIAPRPRRAPWW
jgi:hypothetical protein